MSLGNAFKTVKGKVVTAGLAATMSLAASGAALANDDNLQQTSFNSQVTAASLSEQYKDADIIIQYGDGEHMAKVAERSVRLLAEDNIEAVAVPGLDALDCAAFIYDGEEKARYSLRSILRGTLGVQAERLIENGKLSHRGASDCPDVSDEPK